MNMDLDLDLDGFDGPRQEPTRKFAHKNSKLKHKPKLKRTMRIVFTSFSCLEFLTRCWVVSCSCPNLGT